MGLFQRNPYENTDSKSLYTLGLSKTVLIVGLGNVGKKYTDTRHNIGFAVVDEFKKAHDFGDWLEKKDLKCVMTSGTVGDTRVIIMKPTTYMNLSGQAVASLSNFYKIAAKNILVVHDELDVDFGTVRSRLGGSSAGNNGIKSIISTIGEDFYRLRIGIGPVHPAKMESADFVLAKFDSKEQKQLENLKKEAVSMTTEFAVNGSLPNDTRSFIV